MHTGSAESEGKFSAMAGAAGAGAQYYEEMDED
jgi:hypothetical protein